MPFNEFQKAVLVEAELLAEDADADAAQVVWDGLEEDKRAGFVKVADRRELTSEVTTSLLGTEESPGALRTMMGDALSTHVGAVDEKIRKTVHEVFDKRGVAPTPGTKPKLKPGEKPGEPPVVPEGMVTREEYEKGQEDLRKEQAKEHVLRAISGGKFVNAAAREDAIDFLNARARRSEDGTVLVVLESEDGKRKAEFKPEDAMENLRKLRPHWFASKVTPGTGGGGGGDGTPGEPGGDKDLPVVKSWDALLKDPELMTRYVKEAPEKVAALKEAYFAGEGGELGDILAGAGLSPRTLLNEALRKKKAQTAGRM